MIKTDKNLKSSYKLYEQENKNPVDYKTYKDINLKFYDFVFDLLLEGEEVVLPCKMGIFRIVGTKREKFFDDNGQSILPPDWVKTKKLWERDPEAKAKKQLVRHINEDTGGISYRLAWVKYQVPLRNKSLVSFRLTRKKKRML